MAKWLTGKDSEGTSLLDDILKALSPKQVEDLKLKRCVDCGFFKEGYCTQSSPATKPLTPYDAQLCPYYSPPTVIVTGQETGKPIGYTKIDLVDLITKVSEITTIKTIERLNLIDLISEITTIKQIRDMTLSPKALIVNCGFEQDTLGWNILGTGAIITSDKHWGTKCLSTGLSAGGGAYQNFQCPPNTNWVTQWALYTRVANVSAILRVECIFTDGTNYFVDLTNTSTGLWYRKTFSPTVGKYISQLLFYTQNDYEVKIDDIETVF